MKYTATDPSGAPAPGAPAPTAATLPAVLAPGTRLAVASVRRMGIATGATSTPTPVRVGVQRRTGDQQRTAERINEQVRSETLQNLHAFCTRLNVDALDSAALHVVLLLFSRQFQVLDTGHAMPEAFAPKLAQVDWDAVHKQRKQSSFSTIHDWSSTMLYLETNPDAPCPRACASATKLIAAMQSAGFDALYGTATPLLVQCLLHISPVLAPQEKMLERLFALHARRQGLVPVHDLELRCLKLLTHYNNALPDAATQQVGLIFVNTVETPVTDAKFVQLSNVCTNSAKMAE